ARLTWAWARWATGRWRLALPSPLRAARAAEPEWGLPGRQTGGRPPMREGDRIRVLIVDDHPAVRRGLGAFLLAFEDLELVGEASGGRAALDLCRQARPDVVLMDLVMPEMDGATATQAIRQAHPGTRVIALTSFHEGDLVKEALRAGAIGYLLKNVAADELAGAIRAA